MTLVTEDIKPGVGTIVRADRTSLTDEGFARACATLLDERGVLVFPEIGLDDDEQLALTDRLGTRVNFTRMAAVSDISTPDVYTVTLDPRLNPEPEYVKGTFFWHMDGLTVDIAPPFASVLTCRRTAPKGGQTEFANTMAAFDALDERRALLMRLLEWAAQPAFSYRHEWREGDLVIWNNCGALHRVIPYAADSGRAMRRTSVAALAA